MKLSIYATYVHMVQKCHDQDIGLLKIRELMIDDSTKKNLQAQFDRGSLQLLKLNLAKHLMRCQVLKALHLTHALADEGQYVSVAQRLLRSCRQRHPELCDPVHQESFIGQLEMEKHHVKALQKDYHK